MTSLPFRCTKGLYLFVYLLYFKTLLIFKNVLQHSPRIKSTFTETGTLETLKMMIDQSHSLSWIYCCTLIMVGQIAFDREPLKPGSMAGMATSQDIWRVFRRGRFIPLLEDLGRNMECRKWQKQRRTNKQGWDWRAHSSPLVQISSLEGANKSSKYEWDSVVFACETSMQRTHTHIILLCCDGGRKKASIIPSHP